MRCDVSIEGLETEQNTKTRMFEFFSGFNFTAVFRSRVYNCNDQSCLQKFNSVMVRTLNEISRNEHVAFRSAYQLNPVFAIKNAIFSNVM